MDDIAEVARKVLRIEAEAVAALVERVGDNLVRAVDVIFKSRGKVVVTGMGKSGLVGKKIAATLASTGTSAFFMHPAEASHGDLGMVSSDDVVIAISNSGETEEICSLIPFLKRFSVTLIVLSGNGKSTLGKAADIHLDVSVREEACTLGVVPTASTTAAMAFGDAIAVALLTRRGFDQEDFAQFHPRGALGKKLFIKVKDLMHAEEDLPFVTKDVSLTEVVVEISSKRLGLAVVVDEDRKVSGVITDGDVRRGLQKWGRNFFDMTAEEVMTRQAKRINADELAAKALNVMEEHSITALLVLDEQDRLKGIIHLHDLLKQGIA